MVGRRTDFAKTALLYGVVFIFGREGLCLYFHRPLHVLGTLILGVCIGLLASGTAQRSKSRLVGVCFGAALVGTILGTFPLAESFRLGLSAHAEVLWFPITIAFTEVVPWYFWWFCIATVLIDAIVMMLWFMLSAIAAALIGSVVEVAPLMWSAACSIVTFVTCLLAAGITNAIARRGQKGMDLG